MSVRALPIDRTFFIFFISIISAKILHISRIPIIFALAIEKLVAEILP